MADWTMQRGSSSPLSEAAGPEAWQEPGSSRLANNPLENIDLGGEGIVCVHCKDKGHGQTSEPPAPQSSCGERARSSTPGGEACPEPASSFTQLFLAAGEHGGCAPCLTHPVLWGSSAVTEHCSCLGSEAVRQ